MRIKAFAEDELLGVVRDFQRIAHFLHSVEKFFEFEVGDLRSVFFVQRVEHDDVVKAVQKLGGELLFQGVHDDGTCFFGGDFVAVAVKSHAGADFAKLACAAVGGHDHECVAEVCRHAVSVGESSLVHDLQERVEHVGVCFLDFVEEHDGVGFTSHSVRQLSSFFIADISRRGADEAADAELFAIFAHVHSDERVFAAEELFGEAFHEIGLSHAGRSDKEEGADGAVSATESEAVAHQGTRHLFHSVVLSDDAFSEHGTHVFQSFRVAFTHLGHGDAAHHGDRLCHVVFIHAYRGFLLLLFPLHSHFLKLCRTLLNDVAKLCGALIVLSLGGLKFFFRQFGYFVLDVSKFARHLTESDACSCACFVHGINGFVGEDATVDVACRQRDTRLQGFVGVCRVVVLFVA